MTNEALAKQYKQGKREVAAQLWEQVRRLCAYVAKRWNGYAEIDELMQEGFIVMCEAAESYDESAGVTFSNYYARRLEWHWCRYIARCGSGLRIPDNLYWKVVRYRRYLTQYKKQNGVVPDDLTIARYLKVTAKEVNILRDLSKNIKVRSIYEAVGGEGQDLTICDLLRDDSDQYGEVLDKIQDTDLSRLLNSLIDKLPEQEAEAVRVSMSNESLTEYCRRTGKNYKMVTERKAAGIRRLSTGRSRRQLEQFLKDVERYLIGLRGVGVNKFNRTWTSATEWAALYMMDRQKGLGAKES